MGSPVECTWCGDEHALDACPERCSLCGDLGPDPAADTHLECYEADAAGLDLPATEAERAEWRKSRDKVTS